MKFLLFGTGDYYERYKKWFDRERVRALLDNAPEKQNTEIDGIPVLSPAEGVKQSFDAVVILSFYVKEMKKQLRELGVSENRIFHFYDLHRLIDVKERKIPALFYGGAESVVRDGDGAENRILLLSHDMNLGGPSLALYHMAETLTAQGFPVVFASMIDGPLRERLLRSGIPVVVDGNLQVAVMDDIEWIRNFSRIVCNTVNYHVFLSRRNTAIPVLWWLHDAAFFYEGADRALLCGMDTENLEIVSVGPVPRRAIRSFLPDFPVGTLLYGVGDEAAEKAEAEERDANRKICFVTIGYIETRKGQDILLQAIRRLPEALRQQAVFYLVGERSSRMARELEKTAADLPQVIMTGTLDRPAVHTLLEQADALICPSREDPMPTVAAEAMMHRVPCIISDAAGTADYIQNGAGGLVFPSEDSQRLAEQIAWGIGNPDGLRRMGREARAVYETYFSMERFADALQDFIRRPVPEVFRRFQNGKIAIYGLGAETEKLLRAWKNEFQIVGLLDGYREEGTLYGMPVIPFAVAVQQVKLIIVAARPGSCRAIAKRIGKICVQRQIALYDMRGNNLCREKRPVYTFDRQAGMTKGALLRTMAACDVISFDLFDTLLMRRTLFPSDVFELVDERLRERGVVIEQFAGKRLAAEKELSKDRAPTLTAIYTWMKETYGIAALDVAATVRLEWEIDRSLVVPRKEVCELLPQLRGQGKEIYLVTDSYYTKEQITGLLERCGIEGYTDILVSCEYGTGKTQYLFSKLKEITGEKSCVHIGDDLTADMEQARANGLQACRLHSGIDLLEMAGYMGLWDFMEPLANRIRIGMFVSVLFNSPFQFEEDGKKIAAAHAYDIGWLFFAPLLGDFALWFDRQIREQGIRNILFCARDGYLMQKMHDMLARDRDMVSVYFLTSRTAAIRAGMRNVEDIRYVEKMKFSGSLQEQLVKRFGVTADAEDSGKTCLSDYAQEILERASESRKAYAAYIGQLGIREGDIAFFDFVAKGTSQMFLSRLFANHLKGFYFLQLEAASMRGSGLDIVPFYRLEEGGGGRIFEDYYILETILTSPEPSVIGFAADGAAVYGEETRSGEEIQCVLSAQAGILDYFRIYLKLCPPEARKTDQELDETLLSLIHGITVSDQTFLHLKVEDPFFNRMTDMTDLL